MLTFFPAARKLLDRRTEGKGSLPIAGMKASSDRLLPRLIARTSVLAEKIPVVTLVAALVLGGLGVWGLTQLETRFSFTDFLPKDAPGLQGLEILQEEFGGGLGESTQVLIEGKNLSSPEIHNALVSANRGTGLRGKRGGIQQLGREGCLGYLTRLLAFLPPERRAPRVPHPRRSPPPRNS